MRTRNEMMPPADAGPVERPVRRHPLEVECLYTDDTKTLMSKGHHDPAEFIAACEFWNGGPLVGWGGRIRHAWGRTVPDSSGDYEFLMLPAKPHARGAYPVTTIIDDAAYEHDEDMAKELADRVAKAIAAADTEGLHNLPVLMGTYRAGN